MAEKSITVFFFKPLFQVTNHFSTNFLNFFLIYQSYERQFLVSQSVIHLFEIEFFLNSWKLVFHFLYRLVRRFIGFSNILGSLLVMFFNTVQDSIQLGVSTFIVNLCALTAWLATHESGDLAFRINANKGRLHFMRTFESIFLRFTRVKLGTERSFN